MNHFFFLENNSIFFITAANAGASTQNFNLGGPFGGGLSASSANAQASSQSFNQGAQPFGGGYGGYGGHQQPYGHGHGGTQGFYGWKADNFSYSL